MLVEDVIQEPLPHRVADGLRGGTGGNLLAVVEVVGRLTPEQLKGRDLLPHPLPLGNSAAQRLLRAGHERVPGHRELMAALAVDPYVTVDQARRLAGSTRVVDEAMEAGSIEQTPSASARRTPAEALAAWELLPERRTSAGARASWPTARTPGVPRCIDRSPATAPRRPRRSRLPRSATGSVHPGTWPWPWMLFAGRCLPRVCRWPSC